MKKTVLCIAAVGLGFVIAGCGGQGPDGTEDTSSSATSDSTSQKLTADQNVDFVLEIYRRLLGREPDPGWVGWIQALDRGQASQSVVNGIVYSPEGQGDIFGQIATSGDPIETCYNRLLLRGSDPGGKQYWEEIEAQYGLNTVVIGFLNSNEFLINALEQR